MSQVWVRYRTDPSRSDFPNVNREELGRVYLHETEYVGDDLLLGRYLETLRRPEGMAKVEFGSLRKKSRNFLVRDGYLFKRGKKRGVPPRRVVGLPEQREEIITDVHDEIGHPGMKPTYDRVAKRYQWKGMYQDVVEWAKTCDECQRRSKSVGIMLQVP